MNITTHYAQISTKDLESTAGANISRLPGGYVAKLEFYGKSIYLARQPGDPSPVLIIAPSDKWEGDISAAGYEIIGKVSDIANK